MSSEIAQEVDDFFDEDELDRPVQGDLQNVLAIRSSQATTEVTEYIKGLLYKMVDSITARKVSNFCSQY